MDATLLECYYQHITFNRPVPTHVELRRLAWRVCDNPSASLEALALADGLIWLLDYIQQQNEVIAQLRGEASLAQRELGT